MIAAPPAVVVEERAPPPVQAPTTVHDDGVEHGARRTLITIAVVTTALLELVDVTIVNVALPNIQGNFGAGIEQSAWIGTAYIIANVIIIPITPWLQRRYGRKQYFVASIVVFTVASILCGLAGSLGALICWRVVQGLAGGGLISTSQSILSDSYPLSQQGKAAGIFGLGVIVGPTLGPVLGGMITDSLSWRWAFFINVPLGMLAAALAIVFLRKPERARVQPIDLVGLSLLAIGIGSLQYVLDQGQQKDWFDEPSIVACCVSAGLGLLAFVIWELRTPHPIVDLRILRHRTVWAGSVLGMLLGVSMYGSVLILPQYAQQSLGFTATLSGLMLVMRAAAILVCMMPVALLVQRGTVDSRLLIAGGFALIGISNLMLAGVTTAQSPFWIFLVPLIVGGIGMSQLYVPLTVAVTGGIAPHETPAALAFFNLARQLGGSIAIAVLVTLVTRHAASYHEALAGSITLRSPAVVRFIQHEGGVTQAARTRLNAIVSAQAAVLAYADAARFTGVISLLVVPLAFVLRRRSARVP